MSREELGVGCACRLTLAAPLESKLKAMMTGSVGAMVLTVPLSRPSPRVRVGCTTVVVIVFPFASVVVMVSVGGGPLLV